MKSQRALAQFLTFVGECQVQLEVCQKEFSRDCRNPNSLYRSLVRSTKSMTKEDIISFVKSFAYSLWEPEISGINFKVAKKAADKEQLLRKGVSHLVRQYGHEDSLSFADFCWLAMGDHDTMVYVSGDNSYDVKQALFMLLQTEIQNLLSIEAFKKAVNEETVNLEEAFKSITKSDIDQGSIKKLVEVNGLFLSFPTDKIIIRLKGPLKMDEFKKLFNVRRELGQSKIFYSRREGSSLKDGPTLRDSNLSFGTPIKKVTAVTQSSSNRRPVQSEIRQTKTREPLLSQIAIEQANFERLRQKTLLSADMDLQLIYDNVFDQFSPLLKSLYKDNSFTSFLRFLFPTKTFWQYPYLGFIRHNIDNRLNQQTLQAIRKIKEEYEQKEKRIQTLWKQANKLELFKSLSGDSETISIKDLNRTLTAKEIRLLQPRMDPMNSGTITIQTFI